MTSGTSPPSTSGGSYSFEGFLEGWLRRQDQLLAELSAAEKGGDAVAAVTEEEKVELITRALGHFEEYYEHKSRAAHQNVFSLFEPTWCSALERAFFWITGFRPSVLVQLAVDSAKDLSPQQTRTLTRLKRETRVEEKMVADEMARLQESAAAPPLVDVIKGAVRLVDEEYFTTNASEYVEMLRADFEAVVANADNLRLTTASKVVEVLNPSQCLRFLFAAIRLQQEMRCFQMPRDRREQERCNP